MIMENKFCYLKGLVDCDSGRIQDCNNKRTVSCPLEEEKLKNGGIKKEEKQQGFCYLKGMVDCGQGRVQDCNIKRVERCPLDECLLDE